MTNLQWHTKPHKGLNDYEDTNIGLYGDENEVAIVYREIIKDAEILRDNAHTDEGAAVHQQLIDEYTDKLNQMEME